MSKIDVICDHSQQNLKAVPLRVLEMSNLQMLYLEGNEIETLPENLFQKLPKLSWLDVRNNKLREIPAGVSNHQCLENLLLEQNCLEKLPNELGLVPKLMVLQLANNPLTYPSKDIISEGTQAVSFYLRNEYNKEHDLPLEPEKKTPETGKKAPKKRTKTKEKIDVRELLKKMSRHDGRLEIQNMPTISIRSLSSESSCGVTVKNDGSVKSVVYNHSPRKSSQKVTRYCSKLSIPSHYNSNKYVGAKKCRPNEQRALDQEVKEIWLGKLRELLIEQEKHLQRERNLQALSSWRLMKKLEQPRQPQEDDKLVVAPYDTNPDYERMPSRIDLATDIERILKRRRHVPKKAADMQKLINELVSQLKMLEASNETDRSRTSSDLEKGEEEIQKIINLHKKVIELQRKNESNW